MKKLHRRTVYNAWDQWRATWNIQRSGLIGLIVAACSGSLTNPIPFLSSLRLKFDSISRDYFILSHRQNGVSLMTLSRMKKFSSVGSLLLTRSSQMNFYCMWRSYGSQFVVFLLQEPGWNTTSIVTKFMPRGDLEKD